MEILYFDTLTYAQGDMYVVASDKGLVYIGTPNASFEEVKEWADKPFKGYCFEENSEKLLPYKEQLTAYFKKELIEFNLPIHVKGTAFQLAVWDALKELPYGTTTTYGNIAQRIGNPKAVRAVGTAIGANPILAIIPCHRVIGKNGQLTGFRSGLAMKQFLLELEKESID
ncbi:MULTISPECIES: methylated-DNA--[protein]-cysteine S-methyltransferase [Lysinibacillus]|uniref:methylated-DNA--[protein]-cysteine S-methyltransferase n=1 Tax=Lysinibacillus TaxID=400634 RepID=UPI001C8CD3B0|nr:MULTISPECIES: methylated-DNA--[protein]-cysteine S-methyltransferase [Lysinibacillus]MBX8946474.1 methylated-DNA--[protein]-cysteine S-methyltransferase [Lysinibacillus sp. K60]WDU79044.1 methylated-DNA--[protein]-cysteine S-methyltransferase [Lysinibacillus sp. G01H]WHP41170.1 methylated-DNA--[protein]-cysteine S-methyltransferase [Lysinibacillus boronitolerans]